MARTLFLVDEMGTYKVLLGGTIVSSLIHAAASGETDDPADLARVAAHIEGRGKTLPDDGASAAISGEPGQRHLTFLWANGSQASFPLQAPAPAPVAAPKKRGFFF